MATGGRCGAEGRAAFAFQVWGGGVWLETLSLGQRETVMVQKQGRNPAGARPGVRAGEPSAQVARSRRCSQKQERRGREGAGVQGGRRGGGRGCGQALAGCLHFL